MNLHEMAFPVITRSLGTFDLVDLTPDQILIEDIADTLSNIMRYGGRGKHPYSVAQHSVLVSRTFDSPELAKIALLHDAGEAYLGDVVTPLKRLVRHVVDPLENSLLEKVFEKFGLSYNSTIGLPASVKRVDLDICLHEVRFLFDNWEGFDEPALEYPPIEIMTRKEAKQAFLDEFERLWEV